MFLAVVVLFCSACGKGDGTPLQYAVEIFKPECVLALLDAGAGADVNTVSGFCGLPLPCWVSRTSEWHQDDSSRLVVAQKLIAAGADLEGELSNGNTALTEAVAHGDHEMVRLLVEAGASVTGQRHQWALLLNAASHDWWMGGPDSGEKLAANTGSLKLLLDKGADPNVGSGRGKFRDPHPDRRLGTVHWWWAQTPLMSTARSQSAHPEFVKRARMLIEYGADPHVTTPDGQTALFFAAKYGSAPMVELLLNAGLDPNQPDSEKLTPLGIAAKQGNDQAVSVLVARGADVSIADVHGLTPLMFATQARLPSRRPGVPPDKEDLEARRKTVEALLSAGADPNVRSDAGQIPLLSAASNGYAEAVQLLLSAGADPDARDDAGQTPLLASASSDHTRVEMRIYNESGDRASSLIQLGDAYADVVRSLLSAGADPDAMNADGWTPLLIAARKGYFNVVRLLLEGGADPSHKDSDNKTALELAHERGHVKTYVFMRCWEGTQNLGQQRSAGQACLELLEE